jgi:hypothetical protein
LDINSYQRNSESEMGLFPKQDKDKSGQELLMEMNDRQKNQQEESARKAEERAVKAAYAALSDRDKLFFDADRDKRYQDLFFEIIVKRYLEDEYPEEEAVERAYNELATIKKEMEGLAETPKEKRLAANYMESAERYRDNFYKEKERKLLKEQQKIERDNISKAKEVFGNLIKSHETNGLSTIEAIAEASKEAAASDDKFLQNYAEEFNIEKAKEVFGNLIKSHKKNGLSTIEAIVEASKEAAASENKFLQHYANAGAKVKELDDTKVEWNIIQDELHSLGLPFSAQLSLGYKWDPKGTIIYLVIMGAIIIVPIYLLYVVYMLLT